MNSVVFGFSRARDWWRIGSTIIMLTEKRAYSHCYVRFGSKIFQASHGKVNLIDYDQFVQANIIAEEWEFDCESELYLKVLRHCNQSLGTPYGYVQLLCIAVKKLFHFALPVNNKESQEICSEFAARCAQMLGVEGPTNLDYCTPSDFQRLIEQSGLAKRLLV